jgi:hypothetical protein
MVVACTVVALFVCATAVFAALFLLFRGGGSDDTSARQHLKPIPIDKQACPYVKNMHKAAYIFELVNPTLFGSSDVTAPPGHPAPSISDLTDPKLWPATKSRVDFGIVVLDHTIEAASRHLPKPVQQQLAVTHEQLHLGRIALQRSKSSLDLWTGSAGDINSRGQDAFGNASDLIGMACGVHVGV